MVETFSWALKLYLFLNTGGFKSDDVYDNAITIYNRERLFLYKTFSGVVGQIILKLYYFVGMLHL